MATWTVSLLVALVGIGGTLLSQLMTTKRDDRRLTSEQAQERERWHREDAARSYEHRRHAYMDFMNLLQEKLDKFDYAQLIHSEEEPPDDWLDSLFQLRMAIRVFGTHQASIEARSAYEALFEHVYRHKVEDIDDRLQPFVEEIRRDLSIPQSSATPP